MDNVNIYEIIGVSMDPIYQALNQLNEDEEILIGKHTIRKTAKFYEIENDRLHECFKEKERCYQVLSNLVMFNKKSYGCNHSFVITKASPLLPVISL